MSSLTIALASLGGVVLAGVVAHGAWQARKAGPRRASVQPEFVEQREPVMGDLVAHGGHDNLGGARVDARTEAVIGGTSPNAADAGGDLHAGTSIDTHPDTVIDAPAPASPPVPERRPIRRFAPRLDALIDSIATLTLEAPISGAFALSHLPSTRRAGGKPFLIEGLNGETGEWEQPVSGQRYGEFQAGVQLANRTGAMNEIEYSEFVQKVQGFAEPIGAMADFPDMLEAVASARELDNFASQHDAQLAVRLQARSAAWSVGYIQQHAARHGFVPGVLPGRLVLPSTEEGAPPVLTLTFDSQAALADDPNLSALRDVTLSFDVPQTDPSVQPFVAWQASAQALSLGMDASIVDDNGRVLSAEGFASIGRELGQLYEQLAARDIPAGSAAARRLFS